MSQRSLEDSIPFLQKVDLFAELSAPEIEALAGLFEERVVADSARIVSEGETADSFFIIRTGHVRVVRGAGAYLAQLDEGQYFGEAALFQDIRRIASVEAEGAVRVLVISREAFDRFSRLKPTAANQVLRRIIKELVVRLEKTSSRLDSPKGPKHVDDAEIERQVLEDLGLIRWKI